MKLLLTLLISCCSMAVYCHTYLPPDYVVLKSGDTVYGEVEYYKQKFATSEFYNRIRVKPRRGFTKRYKRKNVVSFRKDGEIYQSFWLREEKTTLRNFFKTNPYYLIDKKNGTQHFLKLRRKGALSYYHLEWIDEDFNLDFTMLLYKENDTVFVYPFRVFFKINKQALADYFKNCPELVSKINNDEIKELGEILKFYNEHCL